MTIQNYACSPNSLTIQVGTTVRWTNLDNRSAHRHQRRSVQLGVLTLNQTYSFTFTTPGTYTYDCSDPPRIHERHDHRPGRPALQRCEHDRLLLHRRQLAGEPRRHLRLPGRHLPPGANITRVRCTKVLVLGSGWPLAAPTTATFSDVPMSSPFFSYVETAVQHGVISGYQDGTFRPGADVTRSHIAKIVVLARQWTLAPAGPPTFTDVPIPATPSSTM